MTQYGKRQLLPSHYRILDQIQNGRDEPLRAGELKALERDYRWGAPGVSDDPSMIDFFDTPRSTLFEGVIRLWNCGWLALKYTNLLEQENKQVKIVDIGAGRGEIFRVLGSIRIGKDSRFEYIALDIDLRKREVFQKLYSRFKHNYIIHDFREGLPFPTDTIDAVICTETIEHVTKEEGEALLKEILRALKPDGVFIFTTPNLSMRPNGSVYHAYEWKDNELKETITTTGFTIVQWFYLGVPAKHLAEFLPPDCDERINRDLLRAVLGPAVGRPGNVIFGVVKKSS